MQYNANISPMESVKLTFNKIIIINFERNWFHIHQKLIFIHCNEKNHFWKGADVMSLSQPSNQALSLICTWIIIIIDNALTL